MCLLVAAVWVVGAGCPFKYGPHCGASGCFRADVFHSSVAPESAREHLKVAFFFRNSEKGERLAKRSLVVRAAHAASARVRTAPHESHRLSVCVRARACGMRERADAPSHCVCMGGRSQGRGGADNEAALAQERAEVHARAYLQDGQPLPR